MPKSLSIGLLMLCAAQPVSAEIWKCPGESGGDRYQNFPCHLDSMGSLPSAPMPRAPSAVAGGPADAAAAAGSIATAKTAAVSEPKVGMTPEDVVAVWGEPVETNEEEPSRGRIETWQYGGGRSVRFNHKRRVVAVQQ